MIKSSERMLNYLSVFSIPRETQGEMFKKVILKEEGETNPKNTDKEI